MALQKEKRDRKTKGQGQASFRIFIGLKSCENNFELSKISDATVWVIHIKECLRHSFMRLQFFSEGTHT